MRLLFILLFLFFSCQYDDTKDYDLELIITAQQIAACEARGMGWRQRDLWADPNWDYYFPIIECVPIGGEK